MVLVWTEPNVELKVYNWTIIQSHSNEKRANENPQMSKCRASMWKLWERIIEKKWKAKWSWNISIPIMMGRWLKTMKLIKYLVLLVFLINCNRLTHASPPPDGATKANNSAILNNSSNGSSNSSTNSAATNRERSTKVSSERMKGKFSMPLYIMQEMNEAQLSVESFWFGHPKLRIITHYFPDHQTLRWSSDDEKPHSRKAVLMCNLWCLWVKPKKKYLSTVLHAAFNLQCCKSNYRLEHSTKPPEIEKERKTDCDLKKWNYTFNWLLLVILQQQLQWSKFWGFLFCFQFGFWLFVFQFRHGLIDLIWFIISECSFGFCYAIWFFLSSIFDEKATRVIGIYTVWENIAFIRSSFIIHVLVKVSYQRLHFLNWLHSSESI